MCLGISRIDEGKKLKEFFLKCFGWISRIFIFFKNFSFFFEVILKSFEVSYIFIKRVRVGSGTDYHRDFQIDGIQVTNPQPVDPHMLAIYYSYFVSYFPKVHDESTKLFFTYKYNLFKSYMSCIKRRNITCSWYIINQVNDIREDGSWESEILR